MSIRHFPENAIARVGRKKLFKRLITNDFKINKAVLSQLVDNNILTKATAQSVALKVLKSYKKKYNELIKEGMSKGKAIEETFNNKDLLVQRVENTIVFEVKEEIKDRYWGEFYRWLPSSADEPDPLHQVKYGEIFQIGKGEMPGDRPGCQCGMEILVSEKRLVL